jgi:hypothetical protein
MSRDRVGLLAIFALMPSVATAQNVTEPPKFDAAYADGKINAARDCVFKFATQLEISGSEPRDIATATLTLCSTEITIAGGAEDLALKLPFDTSEAHLKSNFLDLVITRVVMIRAERHTQKSKP